VVVAGGVFRNLDPERTILGAIGADVIDANDLLREDVLAVARDADAFMIDYLTIDADAIAGLDCCRVICRYGIGVDQIDVAAATRAGIVVTRVPEYCIGELADHTLGLLLAVARRLVSYDTGVRAGRWVWDAPGIRRLAGSTLGIVGMGRIGSAVAARARPIGFRIVGHDPFVSDEAIRSRGAESATLEQLLRESDIVTLHVPLTVSTRGLIGRDELAAMKHGAILVNTARGALIEHDALVEALRSGRLAGAGLDVLDGEPPAPDDPLLSLEHVVITPHAGHFSEQSLVQVQTEAAEEVLRVLTGERPCHAVNEPELVRT
jgi:D-3-phosphoglycerate dehydrogenase